MCCGSTWLGRIVTFVAVTLLLTVLFASPRARADTSDPFRANGARLGSAETVILRVTQTGTGDGSSWTSPMSLVNAMLKAQEISSRMSDPHPVEIWLLSGTWSGSYGSMTIRGLNVAVCGGFAGTETRLDQRDLARNKTIISSGDWPQPGAAYRSWAHNVRLDGLNFVNCTGGALSIANLGTTEIYNCTFVENGPSDAMVICRDSFVKIGNSVFAANNGCAIRLTRCTSTIRNCTIVQNTGSGISLDGESNAAAMNCIFRDNGAGHVVKLDAGSRMSIAFSNVQGGWGGRADHNITADPLFADPANHDYHVRSQAGRWTVNGWVQDAASSPCIDAGDPSSDYSNEPRPNGGCVNMGAYANTVQASRSSGLYSSMCAAMPHAIGVAKKGRDLGIGGTYANVDFWYAAPVLQGNAVYGPCISLTPGNYTVTLRIAVDALPQDSSKSIGYLDVVADFGNTKLLSYPDGRYCLHTSDFPLGAKVIHDIVLPFTITTPMNNVEFRIYTYGLVGVICHSIEAE